MFPATPTQGVFLEPSFQMMPATIQVIAQGTVNAAPVEVQTLWACHSITIKNLLDEIGYANDILPLPGVTRQTLTFIVPYLETIHENQDDPNLKGMLIDQIKNMDTQILYDVLIAANYLEIKELLGACIQQWANLCNENFTDFTSNNAYQKNSIFSLSKQLPPDLNYSCAKKIPSESITHTAYEQYTSRYSRTGRFEKLKSLSFSPDSQNILECGIPSPKSESDEKHMRIWKVVAPSSTSEMNPLITYKNHKEAVTCAAYSPTGKFIASGSCNSDIVILDKEKDTAINIPNSHGEHSVDSVAFSPDERILASCSFDGIKFWDTSYGKLLAEIPNYGEDSIPSSDVLKSFGTLIKFSPDGNILASIAGVDKIIKLWNAASRSLIRTLQGHRAQVNEICFSPDGTHISSVGGLVPDGSNRDPAIIWNVKDGSQIQALHDLRSLAYPWVSIGTNGLQFTSDGSILLLSGHYSLNFWEVSSGKCIFSLRELPDQIKDICISPDGKTAALAYSCVHPVDLIPMEIFEPILAVLKKPKITQALFFKFLHLNEFEPLIDLCNPEYAHIAKIYVDLPSELKEIINVYFTST